MLKRSALVALCGLWAGFAATSAAPSVPHGPAEFLKAPVFRNLGPARQNGRILHVMVDERKPSTFYVVPSTGGLWKTTNNGTTFDSVLSDKSMVSIGHAALAPSNPDIVWVGTGDAASGRIPLRGFGVWKSADAGKTWAHMGLTDVSPRRPHRRPPAQPRHRLRGRRRLPLQQRPGPRVSTRRPTAARHGRRFSSRATMSAWWTSC